MLTLSEDDRRTLLTIARRAIEDEVRGFETEMETPHSEALEVRAGVFVTIEERGELRGCIGHLQSPLPLYRSTAESAQAAAVRDPRFPPLKVEELERVELEISVLSPFHRLHDPQEVEPGRDGLMITQGRRSGLLLPQVASEHGWSREEFLAQTCRKAGLPADAWRDSSTTIETFTAIVFGEKSLRAG